MTFTGCPAHLRRRTLFEKNGACLPVLFHVLEPRVHNLFDAEEFGAEDVAGIVDLTAQVRAQIIDPPIGIAQPTIIHEDANEHRQGGYADRQERLGGVGHELIVARGSSAHPTDPPPTSGKPSSPYSHKDRSTRSEEHTSELQSLRHLVCRLLLEKKNTYRNKLRSATTCRRHISMACTRFRP